MTQQPIQSDLATMAKKLLASPDGQGKVLDFARALYNKGQLDAAAQVEQMILASGSAELKHRWRLAQSARAPANQYLLVNNPERTLAFKAALDAVIKPHSTVLEIGTGSGILSMLAARAGARQVYTCEHQILMAHVAREIIEDNGLSDVITVIAKGSDQLKIGVDIPESVDVILCDVFTGSLLEAGGLGLVARASETFLKGGGQVVPQIGAITGCLAGSDGLEALCRCSRTDGMDLRRFNLFSPSRLQIQPDQFQTLDIEYFSQPINGFEFRIGESTSDRPQQQQIEIEITQSGLITGFLQWTDLELALGIRLHGGPDQVINWPRFLHVFPDPIEVRTGQKLRLILEHNARRFSVWPDM